MTDTNAQQIHGQFYPISDFTIEQYLVGELSPENAGPLEAMLKEREDFKAYIAERRASQKAFLIEHRPPSSLAAKSPSRRWLLGAIPVVVAAAAVFLVVQPKDADVTMNAIRARGGLSVQTICERDGRVFEYRPGVYLREDDRIRFQFHSPNDGVLHVIARTGGAYEAHIVNHAVQKGEGVSPGSLVLDASPDDEVFIVAITGSPLPVHEPGWDWSKWGSTADENTDVIMARVVLEKEPNQ